jgi:hypothetical protein
VLITLGVVVLLGICCVAASFVISDLDDSSANLGMRPYINSSSNANDSLNGQGDGEDSEATQHLTGEHDLTASLEFVGTPGEVSHEVHSIELEPGMDRYKLRADGTFSYYIMYDLVSDGEYVYGTWSVSSIDFDDISQLAQDDLALMDMTADSARFYLMVMTFDGVNSEFLDMDMVGFEGRYEFIYAEPNSGNDWVSYNSEDRTGVIMTRLVDPIH